jgi:hypothetical protein
MKRHTNQHNTNQTINNQSINNRPTNQSMNNRLTNQPTSQPTNQSANQQKPRHIIFFSELCDSCTNLRLLMKNENILHYFEPQCIDRKEDYYKSIGITHVPTLIVPGIQKPLITVDAFKWLQNVKCMRYQNTMNNSNKMLQYNMMKNMQMDGPNAYVSTEMSGLSDKFAYTDTDMAQVKSFSYGNEDPIYTGPAEDDKISAAEYTKLIQDNDITRKQSEKEFEKIMKKGQLQAIIKAEQQQLSGNF